MKHDHAVFEIIKFVLSLTKANNTSTTPEVQAEGLKIIGKMLSLMKDSKIIEIMPGVSSVATKVVHHQYSSSLRLLLNPILLT